MSEILKIQDPAETLDYSLDWTSWLAGDTISTATWAITPTGPTLSSPSVAGAVATTLVAGVAFATIYRLTCTVVTGMGRTSDRSITIRGAIQ